MGAVLLHALYLCNLATADEVVFGKSLATMNATVDAACAIDADGVVFHVGSHLGAGLEAGLTRCVPALRQVLERCSETTWLLLENSAGAGGTIGRSIDELAILVDALDRQAEKGWCNRLKPGSTWASRRRRRQCSRRSTSGSGSTGCGRCM